MTIAKIGAVWYNIINEREVIEMAIIIGISRYGDPFSMREMRKIIQDGINEIDTDELFMQFIEESGEPAEPEEFYYILDEFKYWVISWKIDESDYFPDHVAYFQIFQDGEIEVIDPDQEELFPVDSFEWNWEWAKNFRP